MRAIIKSDIETFSVNRPQKAVLIKAGTIVDVIQESEDLGKYTLYSITDAVGDYIHVYAWEFK